MSETAKTQRKKPGVDRASFLERLRESDLLSDEQVGLAERCAAGGSGEECADALVAEGLLTAFQARQVLAGEVEHLVLGPYRLLDELGRGGMGQVYRAVHTVMERAVAIKVIAPELVEDERAVGWFRREVRALTQLSHPNVVLAYDANEAKGLHFLVMEYVDGVNLDALVRAEGPLPVGRACEMMRQVALALQHARERGLVHRDIKPANLLVPRLRRDQVLTDPEVEPDGRVLERSQVVQVKVVDFGLARLYDPTLAARPDSVDTLLGSSAGSFVGTADYASPEQGSDPKRVDIRSDLYSLGCTFHFALTGRAPFGGDTAMAKLLLHLTEPPPPVTELRPEVPAGVAEIVGRLMAKDPDERFQTPAELARALAPWCGLGGAPAPKAADPCPAPEPRFPAAAQGVTWASEADLAVERTAQCLTPTLFPRVPVLPEAPAGGSPQGEPDALNSPEPAAPPEPPQVGAGPRGDWRRWVEVVEAIARRGRAWGWSEGAYQALHADLLAACRAHAAAQRGARAASSGWRSWLGRG
jgi:serine/threonine-protein kinase